MLRMMAAVGALALMAGTVVPGNGGKIKFRSGDDHDKAVAEAAATGKPVLVYFAAEG